MAILTDYFERTVLDHVFGVAEYTTPSALYVGISTQAFSESDTPSQALAKEPGTSGTTYNANGYSRVSVFSTSSTAGLRFSSMSSDPTVTNLSQISFPQVTTSNWGNIGYWALFPAQIPANGTSSSTIDGTANQKPIMVGSFTAAVTTNVGDQFKIATGDFDVTLPSQFTQLDFTAGNDYANTDTTHHFHNKEGLAFLMGFGNGNKWNFTGGSAFNEKYWLGVSNSAFAAAERDAGTQEPGYLSSANSVSLAAYNNNGYTVRPEIQFGSASTSSGTTTISNTNIVEFPECTTSNWGSISHYAIFSGGGSSAGGALSDNRYPKYPAGESVNIGSGSTNAHPTQSQPIFRGSLDAVKSINVGDTLRFPVGSIQISLD